VCFRINLLDSTCASLCKLYLFKLRVLFDVICVTCIPLVD
jgi:hypothetical protein